MAPSFNFDSNQISPLNKSTIFFTTANPIPDEDKIGDYYKSESYISHSSTNRGLINKIYQRVRKRTLKQKLKLVKKWAKGETPSGSV